MCSQLAALWLAESLHHSCERNFWMITLILQIMFSEGMCAISAKVRSISPHTYCRVWLAWPRSREGWGSELVPASVVSCIYSKHVASHNTRNTSSYLGTLLILIVLCDLSLICQWAHNPNPVAFLTVPNKRHVHALDTSKICFHSCVLKWGRKGLWKTLDLLKDHKKLKFTNINPSETTNDILRKSTLQTNEKCNMTNFHSE